MRHHLRPPLSTARLRRAALGLALLASAAAAEAEPGTSRPAIEKGRVAEAIGAVLHWLLGDAEKAAAADGSGRGHAAEESEVDTEIEVDPPNPPRR